MHVVSEDHAFNRDRRERVRYIGFTAFIGILLLLNATDLFRNRLYIETLEEVLPRLNKTIVDDRSDLDLIIIRRSANKRDDASEQ